MRPRRSARHGSAIATLAVIASLFASGADAGGISPRASSGTARSAVPAAPSAAPKLTLIEPDATSPINVVRFMRGGADLIVTTGEDMSQPGGQLTRNQPWILTGGAASQLIPGLTGSVYMNQLSPDARSAALSSGSALTGVDDPGGNDLYLSHDGTLALATKGTTKDQMSSPWVADNGSRMAFTTFEELVPEDTYFGEDLYVYDAATDGIALAVPGTQGAPFALGSPDGQHVLVGGAGTYYESIGGVAAVRAKGTIARFSADSSRLYFTTTVSMVPSDTDGAPDAYWSGSDGSFHLMDIGLDALAVAPIALFLSADLSHWLVVTTESLDPADTNGTTDWYVGSGSGWTLIPGGLSDAPELVAAPDDSWFVWSTTNALDPSDVDNVADLYRWSADSPDTVTLLTDGVITGTPMNLRAVSDDASRVILSTSGAFSPDDTDAVVDLYRWEGGSLALLSPNSPRDVTFLAASSDGQRVAFRSVDPIVPEDGDLNDGDLYISDEDTTPPVATVDGIPEMSGGALTVALGSTDDTATSFSCVLDGAPLSCTSHLNLQGLAAGSHALTVRAWDAAWNVSEPVETVWTVDATSPTATAPTWFVKSGIGLVGGRPTLRLQWSGSDAGSGIEHFEVAQSTDGGAYATISSQSAPWYLDRVVPVGHTVRFRVRAIDFAGNASPWMYGPTSRISAVSDGSSAIGYGGRWSTGTSSTSYWGGTVHWSSTAGSTASYTFTGRAVSWVGVEARNRGQARVYIDGTLKATVELWSNTTRTKHVIWQMTFSASGRHRITIKVVGTAGRPRVDVDGFIVGT